MNSALRSAAVLSAALVIGSASVAPQRNTDDPAQGRSAAKDNVAAAVPPQSRASDGPAELPRVEVEVPELRATGRTIHVPANGNLQAALDAANGGDRITLEPRATYRGPFRLRKKSTDDWIVVTSAAPDLPKPGRHVTPADAARMPKLVAESGSVFEAEPGAHHFRLVGLEITPQDGVSLNTLVRLGESETTIDAVPHHFIIDRCYIHGDARLGGRRGVALNASHSAVVDSYLSDFKERSVDAQAIAGWNAPGPFKIARNFLEASGENVMFGGADPRIPDAVPSDIDVVQNHMAKPLRWKKNDPSFEGIAWSVKNLFELKNARRVRIDGNLLEYNWPHAQNGFAVLFTVRNQDGGAPWSVVEDVTFSNNLVRHVSAGINVLGRDDNHPSQQTQRITIRNNVFLDVGGKWGNGRLFQLLNGTRGIVIDHNTAMQTGSVLFADGDPHTKLVFQNNVIPHNEHGITGSGTAPGNASLQRYFPGAVFRRNILVGGMPGSYPRDNFFPPSLSEIGLRGAGTDRTLRLEKTFAKQATDGSYPGADIDAVEQALGGLATVELLTATAIPARVETRNLASAGIGPPRLTATAVAAFWLSAAALLYIYIGYPLIAALRGLYHRRQRIRRRIEPSVTIVVVAYNEAARICGRIENLLELDYPPDRRTIVVASDGSTDDTVELAKLYTERGVTVRAFGTRRGKAAALNTIVPTLRSDIVVFADARQRFERHTLRALVDNFSDPAIGGVGGELVLSTGNGPAAAGRGAAFYWRYEKFIRSTEASADSTIGASGAIYAIRRELFEPIPDDTILDDVLIPLRIVRQGYRVVFEPRALAHDSAAPTARHEFVRKARTIAGTFQLFARERWLLSPRHNRLWFETISHKGLRLTVPLLHAALFLSACALATEWLYGSALIGQTAFYLAAFAGYAQRRSRSFIFTVPCAMCVLIWATVVGFIRFVMQRQQVTWERTVWTSAAGEGPSPRAAA